MTKGPPLTLNPTREAETALIESWIRRQRTGDETIQILEAGCGQRWPLRLDGVKYRLTGVDLDPAAIEIRKSKTHDLDDAIVGDLRSVELPLGKFDVIYNVYVLEHVEGAEAVLRSFVKWLRPNGIAIIKIPDPESVHGFMAKMSPHWFHLLYYRYILRHKLAGKPGHPPYRTIYDSVVSRAGMRAFCAAQGLAIEAELGDAFLKPGKGTGKIAVAVVKRLLYLLSVGHLSYRHSNLLYILRKRAESAESQR